jgi:tetratricopeptide (TPR) repeat protein
MTELGERLVAAHARMRTAYWEQKDLNAAIQVGQEALQQGRGATDEEDLGAFKAICYDLGSFTWPGWDEPGISPDAGHLAAGLAAARQNLELAVQLGKGPLPTSRAHWLVGAHLLAAGDRAGAAAAFASAGDLAEQAGADAEAVLNRGYASLARGGNLAPTLGALRSLAGGGELAAQLETASEVFTPPPE